MQYVPSLADSAALPHRSCFSATKHAVACFPPLLSHFHLVFWARLSICTGFGVPLSGGSPTHLWTRISRELVKDTGAWAPPLNSSSGAEASIFLTSPWGIPGLSQCGESLTAQGQSLTPRPWQISPDMLTQRLPQLVCASHAVIKAKPFLTQLISVPSLSNNSWM